MTIVDRGLNIGQSEWVGIFPCREFGAESVEFLVVEYSVDDVGVFLADVDGFAFEVDSCRVTCVKEIVVVGAFAVDATDVGFVFDGTSFEELIPSIYAHLRPVGDSDKEVILVGFVATPDRETDVVADYHSDVPATISDEHSVVTS